MFGWSKKETSKPAPPRAKPAEKPALRPQSKHAHNEIHAYIAIRDRLLSEAEENPTNSTLHRAWIANDVVEIFLKPMRTPYEAQHLPEDEAAEQRKRCATVNKRITELRKKAVTPSAGKVQKPAKSSVFGVRAIGTTPA
jgi:hypothetical protein